MGLPCVNICICNKKSSSVLKVTGSDCLIVASSHTKLDNVPFLERSCEWSPLSLLSPLISSSGPRKRTLSIEPESVLSSRTKLVEKYAIKRK